MRVEGHYTPAGYVSHVVVDAEGMQALRSRSTPTVARELVGAIGDPSGVPVYLDECPCSGQGA